MKDLFDKDEDVDSSKVKDTGRTEEAKGWWIGRKCTFCGSDKKLTIQCNGIVRCEKHIRT